MLVVILVAVLIEAEPVVDVVEELAAALVTMVVHCICSGSNKSCYCVSSSESSSSGSSRSSKSSRGSINCIHSSSSNSCCSRRFAL